MIIMMIAHNALLQEAGGFVAMNGVWRVQGVLATSRALGDYPLKVGSDFIFVNHGAKRIFSSGQESTGG